MNRNTLWLFAAATLCLAGCASPEIPADVSPDGGRGEKIVRSIVDADYTAFARAAGEADRAPDAKEFAESCRGLDRNFGKADSFRYLGALETPLLVNQLWAVRFIKGGGNGKKVAHEQLLQLIFGREDDQLKLLGMRFI